MKGREGEECRGRCVCVCGVCSFFTRNEGEGVMEAESGRKRLRRRRGRCKDSFETKTASSVKEKTGEGGRKCMKTTEVEACE